MIVRYVTRTGVPVEVELGDKPITIGRSPRADIVLDDEKVSRLHCGLEWVDGRLIVRDLKSKNGTYVNGERIDSTFLKPGDRIRVGSTVLTVEETRPKGTETILAEVAEEMAQGKGYTTILREIVQEVGESESSDAPEPDAPTKPKPGTSTGG